MLGRPTRLLALAALASVPAFGTPADPDRGRALYEARCLSCHGESVHSRGKRAARDFAAIRQWVVRWNDNLGARWGADEIDDVTAYLNRAYYRYPCPPETCKVVSLMDINRGGGGAPYLGGR